jgi:hypothetical protein
MARIRVAVTRSTAVLALPDKLVNRGWMNSEQLANFSKPQHFRIVRHRIYDPFRLLKIWNASPSRRSQQPCRENHLYLWARAVRLHRCDREDFQRLHPQISVGTFLFPVIPRKIILIATFVEDTDREEGSKKCRTNKF